MMIVMSQRAPTPTARLGDDTSSQVVATFSSCLLTNTKKVQKEKEFNQTSLQKTA